ncbi:hypothetical protein, partial [uncultured Mitsuokella sp.]|uniref:hypothetical protein n=1 Tax=uncultured Mitsuokella sp. TaxID=453120 RepID=UPI0025F49A6D
LESQMIHVALFSFQRTTFVSSEVFVLRSLRHLLFYRSLFSLSRDFKISFLSELETICFQMLAIQGFAHLPHPCLSRRLVLYYTLPDGLSTGFIKKHENLFSPALMA